MTNTSVEAIGDVNLRASPNPAAELMGFLPKGAKAILIEVKTENGFELIRTANAHWYGGREQAERAAWVAANWIRPSDSDIPDVRYVASSFASVRSGPSLETPVIRVLGIGKPVTIVDEAEDWVLAKVDTEAKAAGYIYAPLLRAPNPRPIEALVAHSRAELKWFGYGKGKEYNQPYKGRIGQYWRIGTGQNLDGGDRDQPWSAAFISWLMTRDRAYKDFLRSAGHSRYINWAIRNRRDQKGASFWGYRITERRPQVGDLIAKPRAGSGVTYDNALRKGFYKSHGDLVVGIYNNTAHCIGGNLSNSVAIADYRLKGNGHLAGSRGEFAVLANRAT